MLDIWTLRCRKMSGTQSQQPRCGGRKSQENKEPTGIGDWLGNEDGRCWQWSGVSLAFWYQETGWVENRSRLETEQDGLNAGLREFEVGQPARPV